MIYKNAFELSLLIEKWERHIVTTFSRCLVVEERSEHIVKGGERGEVRRLSIGDWRVPMI
jgi:hypothetical protein